MKCLDLPIFASLLLIFLVACGPAAPSEREARTWFEADTARIQTFDDGVRAHIAGQGLIVEIAEDDEFIHEKGALMRRARATFREIGLPDFTRQAGALRAEVRLLDGGADAGPFAEGGVPPVVREAGTVDAADGFEVAGRKVGWGVYGVEDSDGVLSKQRGYEVYWEAEVEGRRAGFRLFMPAP